MRRIKPLTAIALCALLIFTTTAADCEKTGDKTPAEQKAEFLSYAKDINQAFISFGPIIAAHKPEWKSKWDTATSISAQVIKAVEASNETEVVRLIAELIPIVNETVAQFTDNTTALIILAAADIGLHLLVNHYNPSESSGRPSAAARRGPEGTLLEFKTKPVWGCSYLPDKKACKALRKAA